MGKTYHRLSIGDLVQDWSDTAQISVDDNWAGVASIEGYRGDELTSATGVNPQTIVGTSPVELLDVNANRTDTNTFATGGVTEFQLADPVVALAGSATGDAPYLALYLDTTGRTNVTLTFVARDIDGSIDNAVQQIAVQYRLGDSGPWVNLPAGYVADASSGPSLATLRTNVSVTVPADAANQPQLQLRIMTTNAVGSDEWIGIDDIRVTSSQIVAAQPGSLSIGDASLVEGDSGAGDMVFTVTRSGGSDGAVSAVYEIKLDRSANAADLGPVALTGTVNFAAGQLSATIRVPIGGDTQVELNESFSVLLSAPTGGATLGDAAAIGTILSNDFPPLANVFINEFHYDDAGNDIGEFIEVAGLAGTELTGWSLVLYNGNGGAVYGTLPLTGVLGDQANGFGFRSVLATGIQNGAPDGIALVDNFGRVVQFISYEGVMTATTGPAAGRTSTDIGVEQEGVAEGSSLQLTGTGSSYGDFTWVARADDNPGFANIGQTFLKGTDEGQIRVADASVAEGNAGTTALTFTVARAGGFATEASVAWSLAFGGLADAGDLVAGQPTSGTVTFAAGETRKTITIQVSGDTLGELSETLSLTLGHVAGNAAIVDGAAIGTIVNDDLIRVNISTIQGAGHVSDFVGQPVVTSGIVTALTTNGFWLQDAAGDSNAATSDAIFVFTSSAPTVAVGDAAEVTGRVSEFARDGGLSVTQITLTSVAVSSGGNALPAATLIGIGGLLPPTETIDDDGLSAFDPATDGIDFWESLEGMRVTLDAPLVVSNTNTRGETDVVVSTGIGATGVNERGGITISTGDYNPEKIQIDYTQDNLPLLSQGDVLASVTGILTYSFDRYEVLATEAATVTRDVTLADNDTTLSGDANYVSIATFNVENLDPTDGALKFSLLAKDIVYSLKAPDIIAVQELQDADGAGSGGNLSGTITANLLIDAIFAESGIRYSYAEIAPSERNTTGGEPNGNIRNGYLYQDDRVDLVEGSLMLIDTAIFTGTRRPLVATWSFQGEQFTTVNVHFTSRGGSDPLWGATQPPQDAGDAARLAQADAVGDYVTSITTLDSSKQFVILGDWNGFYFEEAQQQLTRGGVFTNLAVALLPEEERYSYVFDGNAQLLDNMLATSGLLAGARYDAVHINAEFTNGNSDHDPQLALLLLGTAPKDIVLAGGPVAENRPAGTVVGTLSATDAPTDTLTYALVDDAGGRFTVNAAGVLSTTIALNYEAGASYDLIVRVTDSAGQFTQNQITVAVGDVNEAPTAAPLGIAVAEDATSANLWSQLVGLGLDPDAGDLLSIGSVDGSATLGSLLFDAATRTLRYVADNEAFDRLADGASATDSFTYTLTDRAGLASSATVSVTINAVADTFVRAGGNGDDGLLGGAGEDRFSGNNGNDRLFGFDGLDRLDGGNGNDLLDGGAGSDVLIGGKGDDVLIGGSGRDSFVFASQSGNDVIRDFVVGSDKLSFTGTAIRNSATLDANGDGMIDLKLALTGGGSVTLLGIATLAGVEVVTAEAPQSVQGWIQSFEPTYDTQHTLFGTGLML